MSDPMASLRAEVMAQPPADRVEYALDLVAFYLAPLPAFYQGLGGMGLALAPADARMLHALDRKRGKYISNEALVAARGLTCPPDEWCAPSTAATRLTQVRAALDRLDLPVKISNWRGVGYCLDAPEWFQFSDGRAALDLVRANYANGYLHDK